MTIERLTEEQVAELLDDLDGINSDVITIYSEEDVEKVLEVRKPFLFKRAVNYFKILACGIENASRFYYEQRLRWPEDGI